VKLPKVALPTRAPPQDDGRSSNSTSQRIATVSTRFANSDEARMAAFWSSSEVSQSPAMAAGVEPPITKW